MRGFLIPNSGYYKHLPDFDKEIRKQMTKHRGEPETETNRFIFWAFPSDTYCGVEMLLKKEGDGTSVSVSYYYC